MKTLQNPLFVLLFIVASLNVYSNDSSYPQFLFTDNDIEVFTDMVNKIRGEHGLHAYRYKKDTENASRERINTIYKKIFNKTYEQVRDSAYEWLHYGMFFDLHSYNVSLDLDRKGYSMIGPGEICAGYLYVNKALHRDSLFSELLTGWLNSPPHRAKLLNEYDDTFAVSFANFGKGKGIFSCMVIFSEFKVKKGNKNRKN